MAQQVHATVQDGVATLTLDRPPANALHPTLREALLKALSSAIADPDVTAIVLRGAGGRFSSGIDLPELDGPVARPSIPELADAMETAPKPVVCALHGICAGAAFDLALAAHGRVIQTGTLVSFPEINLGLIPGGGATQRLPRLLSADLALEVMLSGKSLAAEEPDLAPLFDRVVPHGPFDAARDLAAALAAAGTWRRTRDRDPIIARPAGFQNAIATLRKDAGPDTPAADLLECVEAAQLLPFAQGVAFEQARYQARAARPEARAIRHVYMAERRAMPVAPGPPTQETRDAVVFGTSAQVAELAALSLALGLQTWIECGEDRQTRDMRARVVALLDGAVASGALTAPDRDARLARLHVGEDGGELDKADLVFDTAQLNPSPAVTMKPGAAWCVVNSPIAPGIRAGEVGAEGQILSLRVGRPTHAARLLEVGIPAGTPPSFAAQVARALSKRGRSAIVTSGMPCGVVERMLAASQGAALVMLAGGVAPARIEAAATGLGFLSGPLRMIDDTGAVPALRGMKQVFDGLRQPSRPLRLLSDRLADLTDGGRAPERGAMAFHRADGEARVLDPDLAEWLAEWREDNPDRAVPWPDVDLSVALHAAVVNAIAPMLAARQVSRASDIDLAAVKGGIFDRRKGGPLLQADLGGLLPLMRAMAHLSAVDPVLWSPHARLSDMVKNGRRFFDGARGISPA